MGVKMSCQVNVVRVPPADVGCLRWVVVFHRRSKMDDSHSGPVVSLPVPVWNTQGSHPVATEALRHLF
jgi:hypothetical protein